MGVYLGRSLFSATLLFFFIGLIFAVVGYVGHWLKPRSNLKAGVTSLGVRQVCFDQYTAFDQVANVPPFSGCHDTSKNSQSFAEVPEKYVSPGWYRRVQEMHFTTLVLMLFATLLALSFLISYCMLNHQLKRRRRPSSALILSKAGLSFWFLLPFICGLLQLSGATVFLQHYERERHSQQGQGGRGEFFLLAADEYEYGEGLYLTFVAGACLLVSALLGLVISATVIRKMLRLSHGDAMMVFSDEFASIDPHESELERLSDDVTLESDHTVSVQRKTAYPTAAPRQTPRTEEPTENDMPYQNIPKSKPTAGSSAEPPSHNQVAAAKRPTPLPRSSSTTGSRSDRGFAANQNQTSSLHMECESRASTEMPPSVFTSNYGDGESLASSQRSGRNKTSTRYSGPAPTHRQQAAIPLEPRFHDADRAREQKNKKYTAY